MRGRKPRQTCSDLWDRVFTREPEHQDVQQRTALPRTFSNRDRDATREASDVAPAKPTPLHRNLERQRSVLGHPRRLCVELLECL